VTASVSSSNRFPEIDKYELLEEIGHGGMATVYRARDMRLGREVAVKVIHKHLRENVEVRSRFVAEARAVAKLRHPGIVDVYDVSAEEDEERYLVVELIRGKTLRQVLTDHQVLPAEIAATMVAVLCDAVEHAHTSSVVHRDIKPENVLIEIPGVRGMPTSPRSGDPRSRPSGEGGADSSGEQQTSDRSTTGSSARSGSSVEVKLTDFGIAKVLDAQGVTSTGQILGSPAHMAPEQIEGGDVGPRTDVFALGVLLYECMVGHLPFEGKNPAQVLRRVLEGDYEAADSERAEVGGRWARILAGALAKELDQRIASAGELGDLIDAELAALGVDDPQGDLNEYFADPKGYEERSKTRMVPRLLARGEQERKRGNVLEAAVDFNRALALRPDDLAILKRVSALSAERVWKERAIRLGAIVLGAAALGGAAFGITKAVSAPKLDELASASSRVLLPSATRDLPAPRTDAPSPTPTPSPDTDPEDEPSSTVAVAPDPAPVVSTAPSSSSSVGSDEVRPVVFRVTPGHVKIQVDGAAVGTQASLKIGGHTVTARDACCKDYSAPFQVRDDPPEKKQLVTVNLVYNDAMVALVGAPDGGYMFCGTKKIGKGGSASFEMSSMTSQLSCNLSNGKSATVDIQAGATNTVTWPN
jgi:eukaryotic-like serine/threonine-protein kinase